jgi:poly(A) polymerase Pap1
MKKFIITLALVIIPSLFFAQTTAFNRLENIDGIATATINKKMFEVAGNLKAPDGKEQVQQYMDMAKGIESLKVFSTSVRKHRKEMSSAVADYLKQNPLDELMSVNSDNTKVKIYINKGSDAAHITECLVFIEDFKDKDESILLSMIGNINLSDLDLDNIKNTKK